MPRIGRIRRAPQLDRRSPPGPLRLIGRRISHLPPPSVLALLYLTLVLIGAALLKLPMAHRAPLNWADAIFTSTSAVTVTGLAVVDTGGTFTPFGISVIAVLIQLGGLGLMSFAVLLLSALGVPIGMPHRIILREDLNQTSFAHLMALVRLIVVISILAEALGALLLAFVFVPDAGLWPGLGQAVFHSISAFNNAGFALWPDSLTRYVGDPLVNLVVPGLFIIGGLGFIVIADLWEKRGWRKLTLHSKLMLVGTAILIVMGTVIFAGLEWRNPGTLGPLDWDAKLWASWFQAVSPRTAGFNTVDLAQAHDSTALMVMSMMLIGGGSTSTAGGIKVTTVAVLLLATVAFFRRTKDLQAYNRSLGPKEVLKVLALTTVSLLVVMTAIFAIAISHDGDFLDLAFEVTSAFGTTGLSRGSTAELDGVGRIVIMTLMFLGRVGPLTLGFFLATRSQPRVRYPEGQVYLG